MSKKPLHLETLARIERKLGITPEERKAYRRRQQAARRAKAGQLSELHQENCQSVESVTKQIAVVFAHKDFKIRKFYVEGVTPLGGIVKFGFDRNHIKKPKRQPTIRYGLQS